MIELKVIVEDDNRAEELLRELNSQKGVSARVFYLTKQRISLMEKTCMSPEDITKTISETWPTISPILRNIKTSHCAQCQLRNWQIVSLLMSSAMN